MTGVEGLLAILLPHGGQIDRHTAGGAGGGHSATSVSGALRDTITTAMK